MANSGVRGAKMQSWKAANPRELLSRIIDSNPGGDRDATMYLFRTQLASEPNVSELVETIIEYWFTNNYYSLVGPTLVPRLNTPDRKEKIAQTVRQVKRKIAEAAQIVLMEMMMPNGKKLTDCTGSECREMGPVIGNWLGLVARHVKARDLVGQTLTEAQLQAFYRGNTHEAHQ